jgi:hypothetical protein
MILVTGTKVLGPAWLWYLGLETKSTILITLLHE